MNRNKKFGIGAAILVAAIAYLVYAGVQQGSVYYFTIDEFWVRSASLVDQSVRVSGRVADGSVKKKMTPHGTELDFALSGFPGEEDATGTPVKRLPVHFIGLVPDMFAEGRDVIVEGTYQGGRLEAHTLMTSCPSKYEPGKDRPSDTRRQAS